jgi:hypothetical protein
LFAAAIMKMTCAGGSIDLSSALNDFVESWRLRR